MILQTLRAVALFGIVSEAFIPRATIKNTIDKNILALSSSRLNQKISSDNESDIITKEREELKRKLFELIPSRRFHAPATNVTCSPELSLQIAQTAKQLEPYSKISTLVADDDDDDSSSAATAALELLDGEWFLIYSDASEILNLDPLPLGFQLGPVYQPIDIKRRRVENQANVKHSLWMFSGHTRIIATISVAERGEDVLNRAGWPNTLGLRVNVAFERAVFTLRRFLIIPTFGRVRKVSKIRGPAEISREQGGPPPCIEIVYLDEDLRVSFGGDGSLFILRRCPFGRMRARPMLGDNKIENVSQEAPQDSTYNAATDILPKSK